METIHKKIYKVPFIEKICIDNEISLALESDPPTVPDEYSQIKSDNITFDAFKTINC